MIKVLTIEVKYEDLKGVSDSHLIKGHAEVVEKLTSYLQSKEGKNSRESNKNRITIKETIKYGEEQFVVETIMNPRDLYVKKVSVYQLGKLVFTEEVTDTPDKQDITKIGSYYCGTSLKPIQLYLKFADFKPGSLIRSQAFRISEAVRFKKRLGYKQVSTREDSRGYKEKFPEFMTFHKEKTITKNGEIIVTRTKYESPFEYANKHREREVDFGMFEKFFGDWEDLSSGNITSNEIVDVLHMSKKTEKN